MNESDAVVTGMTVTVIGVLLVIFRDPVSRFAAGMYKKIGIEVPAVTYARQFFFAGMLLAALGLAVATGWFRYL